jgi:hypothetical protein
VLHATLKPVVKFMYCDCSTFGTEELRWEICALGQFFFWSTWCSFLNMESTDLLIEQQFSLLELSVVDVISLSYNIAGFWQFDR